MDRQGEQPSKNLDHVESSMSMDNNPDKSFVGPQINIAGTEPHEMETHSIIPPTNEPRIIEQTSYGGYTLPPYKIIPAELVKEIISCYVREGNPTLRKDDPRIQVTQICSAWRNFAFGTSELWNMHLEKIHGEYTVNLLAAWLRQCTNTYISLTMSHADLTQLSYGSLFIKEVVIPNARRFKVLSCPPVLPGQWRSLPFDSLTTLYLSPSPFPTYEKERLNAPSLRTLGIIGIAKSHAIETGSSKLRGRLPKMPWKRLTSIELTGTIPFIDIYWILSNSTSLEKCAVNSSYQHSRRRVTDLPVVNMPNLKDLQISFVSERDCDDLLHFDSPNLVSLTTTVPSRAERAVDLKKFLATKAKTLRHFTIMIANFGFYNISMYGLMRVLPLVTHFSARDQVISLSTLADIGSGNLLPKVEVLEFTRYFEDTISAILAALLPLKGGRTHSLKEITIVVRAKEHLHPEARIEDLRLQGIVVRRIERGHRLLIQD
ncbi:hypothetical protein BDZ94DRAFT_1300438 [Collybia nuda]|uniref:Uncharacterized protein n=1 Tax=Collybia nuda TaxID=64659 RepID=A0A9P6CG39_9AGAR|nr:hypothetical protein BDZ94DRAFT_1300438 [Collybia nuda]